MASEVDICNLALGRLGDDATVSSIDPPEGSVQSSHCARFYPIARDSMLEMHQWGFATRRTALALLAEAPPSQWRYAYAMPAGALNLLAVTASDAQDDYSTGSAMPYSRPGSFAQEGFGLYAPQPYVTESMEDGAGVIYTNQQNAVLRFTGLVSDTSKFSPLFADALGWLLASHLAGPILKGETGAAAAKSCMQMFNTVFGRATVSDANQRRATVAPITPWLANR